MANSFSSGSFNPRMIMGQPTFIIIALAVVGIGGYFLYKKVSSNTASAAQPSGQANQTTDTTLATGTMNTIQNQISTFSQQIASIPTSPTVPTSSAPVAVGVGGHSTT